MLTVNQPLPLIPCPAIKQLLLSRLQAALSLYVSQTSILNKKRDYHISLYRAQDHRSVLYISAIALQLSAAENTPALEIATALTTLIRSFSQEFTVQVVPPGLIHLEIAQPYVAAWLQYLTQGEQGRINSISHLCLSPSRIFAIQYAHARCCSLLRMADREGLITLLSSPPASPAPLLLLDPQPIPWLNGNQLRLGHASELALISQLLELLDDLYWPNPSHSFIDYEKAAFNLSEVFQTFYSCSRIWGEVKRLIPHLAQARLGLVLATQSVLRLLLQLLVVPAPLEL